MQLDDRRDSQEARPAGAPVGVVQRSAVVVDGGAACSLSESVVLEEPLEIRVAGDPLATTLRTPGQDHALALGFLFAEGVITSASDVGTVAHCGRPGEPGYGNAIDVLPGPGVALDPERLREARRSQLVHAGCGACGREQIDALLARTSPVPQGPWLGPRLLDGLAGALADAQLNFAHTGGLHAAVAIDARGAVHAAAEDIGRHNAVDKVVGRLLLDAALPGSDAASAAVWLGVSGRCGFEIVQKAAVAGFRAVASVSAASSLAIDTAEALGITLAGFVREGRFTLYCHAARLLDDPDLP